MYLLVLLGISITGIGTYFYLQGSNTSPRNVPTASQERRSGQTPIVSQPLGRATSRISAIAGSLLSKELIYRRQ